MYHDLLRRLAFYEPTGLPVLSVYLDMRPAQSGKNPTVRAGGVNLEERLHEIEKTLDVRGTKLKSFREDINRTSIYLSKGAARTTLGIAIFACAYNNLWEVIEVGIPFDAQISINDVPDLFQLARLLDEQETAVTAIVDSNTARLFVTRMSFFDEMTGLHGKNIGNDRRQVMGGWSQVRYQRHIDELRTDFVIEIASFIERLVQKEKATHLVMVGDEIAVPLLHEALSPMVIQLLRGEGALRLDVRSTEEEIWDEVQLLIAEVEAANTLSLADQLLGAVRGTGLGVVGFERTIHALEYGQGDVLLLDPAVELDEQTRNHLIGLAVTTGTEVEVVDNHPVFQELGGVGVLLRYQ